MHNRAKSIQTILDAFRERGHEAYHGEPVSQLEHAVQTAELARKAYPEDVAFILAAFLHDYGHLCESPWGDMDGYGTWDHELLGAEMLQKMGFSKKVITLVANHVQAK